MRRLWTWAVLVAVGVLCLTSGSAAEEEEEVAGEGSRGRVVAAALDVLRIRLEARLGQAESLRALGRHAEALETFRSVDALYVEMRADIGRLLASLGPAHGPAEPPTEGVPEEPVFPEPPEETDAGMIGVGSGGAGGAFRGRRGQGSGEARGGPAASTAVEDALRWLAAHQSPDGGWEAEGFGKWCDGKPSRGGSDGAGKPLYDTGVTGLALLAFLGAGYTNRGMHPYATTVARGLRYLKNMQDTEGCFGHRTSQHFIYNHATAALAMVEAYGMTGSPIFKGSAQKALDFVAVCRNPYFGWRYGVRPGDNDTSVTGWMLMVLKSAQLVNDDARKRGRPEPLVFDDQAFEGARTWIDKMTDPEYGRTGYIQRGGAPARPQELIDRFPGDKSEAMTAVGLLSRIFLGEDPHHSDVILKGASLLAKLPPAWEPEAGTIDMYYWFYGSLAAFQIGGATWQTWSEALERAVLANQRQDGDPCQAKGSWDPIDPWGTDGGRVYSTALLCMCMEVTYRYARVFGAD